MRILVHAPQLFVCCRAALNSLDVEVIEATTNHGAGCLPADVNGIVIEANQPNAGAGFLLAIAVQQKLPVLCLVEKGLPLPEPLNSVRANPAYNRQLKLVRYSLPQVRHAVEQFVATCAGRGGQQPTIKFTLRLTPALDNYLSWRAGADHCDKAQLLRKILAYEIITKDVGYQEHLLNISKV